MSEPTAVAAAEGKNGTEGKGDVGAAAEAMPPAKKARMGAGDGPPPNAGAVAASAANVTDERDFDEEVKT